MVLTLGDKNTFPVFTRPTIGSIFYLVFWIMSICIMFIIGHYMIPAIFLCIVYFEVHSNSQLDYSEWNKCYNSNLSKVEGDIILRFCRHLLDQCSSLEERKRIVKLAIMSWNASFSGLSNFEKEVYKITKKFKNITASDTQSLAINLMQRRLRYYRKHDFMIIKYKFSVNEKDILTLQVMKRELIDG